MKKALSLISSALLTVAVALPAPALAQHAKKLVAAPNRASVEQSVATQKPERRGFHVAKPRSFDKNSTPSLSRAMTRARALAGHKNYKPLKAAANLPDLRGSVVFNTSFTQESSPVGLYSIGATSTELIFTGPKAQFGGVLVDGIYYTVEFVDFGFFNWVEVHRYDIETGTELAECDGEYDNIAIGGMTYDATTGYVYGITYNSDLTGVQLSKIEATEEGLIPEAVAALTGNWNSIACDSHGQLYAISYETVGEGDDVEVTSSSLCKIDKNTGAVTLIGETGQQPTYLSSATIDPKTDRMFWNVCPADESGLMCEVNLATGQATVLGRLQYDDEVMGMYVVAPLAEDKAPAAPTGLAATFSEGSLSGTVAFQAPETLFDGTAASGSLSYKITANGAELAQGTTTYGATVSAPATLPKSGKYNFEAVLSNSVGDSPVAKTSAYVGMGTPAATTATLVYADGKMKLTWTPVEATVDGGYINASAVTYTVTRYPDATVVADKTAATSYEEAVAEPENITQYYYTVVAHSGDTQSAVAESNVITLGNIVPPYANSFSKDTDIDGYTVIDANGDGKKWSVVPDGARMTYNTNLDMDDWLITPPVKLEAGKVYFINFNSFGSSASYPERVEMKAGMAPTAEAMTITVVEPTVIESVAATPTALEGTFIPETSGLYYFGFHGISDADRYYLYVNNFTISAPTSTAIPGEPTDVVATPDINGALKATVAFKAPTVTMGGASLASITKIEVSRDDEIVKTFSNPAPGAALSFDDTLAKGGNVTYTVQGFNADGAGLKASASAFVGLSTPAAPAGVKMVEAGNTGTVTITWDEVTTDINGKTYPAGAVKYKVAEYTDYGWSPITDELTATTYSLQAVAAGEQDFVQYAVFALYGDDSNGAVTGLIPVGTPYTAFHESFPDGNLSYAWASGYSAGEGAWDIYTDERFTDIASADGDNGYAGMKGQYLDSTSGLFTGKISLEGTTDPGISFSTYVIAGDNPDINEIQIYVKEPADADWTALGAPIVVNTLSDAAGWTGASVSLAAYAGKTVQVRFQATTKQYVYTMIDNIKIGDLLAHDLVAKEITAPSTVAAGADYNVNVTVANEGMQDAGAFSVELYADGKLADTKNVDALATGLKTTLAFGMTMSAVATEPVELYAKVVYTADENQNNNTTATISVEPKHSKLPAVTDLAGENTAAGVALAWSEPDLSNAPVEAGEVDFEDGTAWAQEYAGWTFLDLDDKAIGGFQGIDLPGLDSGSAKASFFVFDASGDEFNATFDAHSGNMYLASMYVADGTPANDWAISPALDGSAQTITFYARSYSDEYPESIEMLYSTGSLEPADFISVKTLKPVPGGMDEGKGTTAWTEVSFDVPAGAKHFAIRSYAADSFMLMLDDFSFSPAGGTSVDLSIVGYDVYRDGVKITAEPTGETEYIDTEATDGNHSYVVVTVYTTGTSAPSNAVSVAVSGISDTLAGSTCIAAGKGCITVTGADGCRVDIAALDGKHIYSAEGRASHTVRVATGVYVVKAGTTVAKVAVK